MTSSAEPGVGKDKQSELSDAPAGNDGVPTTMALASPHVEKPNQGNISIDATLSTDTVALNAGQSRESPARDKGRPGHDNDDEDAEDSRSVEQPEQDAETETETETEAETKAEFAKLLSQETVTSTGTASDTTEVEKNKCGEMIADVESSHGPLPVDSDKPQDKPLLQSTAVDRSEDVEGVAASRPSDETAVVQLEPMDESAGGSCVADDTVGVEARRQNDGVAQEVRETAAAQPNSLEEDIANEERDQVPKHTSLPRAPTTVSTTPRGRSVSGRNWKTRKQSQRASMQVTTATDTLSSSWAKKLELKAKRKAVMAMEQEMRDRKRQQIEEKKQERLEREKRRQQNEMKNTTYQTISKTHKLKTMNKKQLRQIKKRQVNARTGEVELVSPWGGGRKK